MKKIVAKVLLEQGLRHGPRLLPGLLPFLKRWGLLLALGGVVVFLLLMWLGIALVLWAWNTLPHLLAYIVGHFSPVWQAF